MSRSLPNILEMHPDQLIKSASWDEYENLQKDIWWRLIQVHETIISLELIAKFPFELFLDTNGLTFWHRTYWNFVYASITLLFGLITDSSSNVHTLPKFKNRIIKDFLRPEYKDQLRDVLKEWDRNKFQEIEVRVTGMRHNIVAHRTLDTSSGLPNNAMRGVTVSELREVYDHAERLFRILGFGHELSTTTIDYADSTVGGEKTNSSLERLLDLVARSSYFVNKPEFHGEHWQGVRACLDPSDIDAMNEWRSKFGLPKA